MYYLHFMFKTSFLYLSSLITVSLSRVILISLCGEISHSLLQNCQNEKRKQETLTTHVTYVHDIIQQAPLHIYEDNFSLLTLFSF